MVSFWKISAKNFKKFLLNILFNQHEIIIIIIIMHTES